MYSTIPKDTKRVYIDYWGCGDDCCCQRIKIFAELNTPYYVGALLCNRECLWESTWINAYWDMPDDYKKDLDDLRKEVLEACRHYSIVPNLDDEIYDWEGQNVLVEDIDEEVEE